MLQKYNYIKSIFTTIIIIIIFASCAKKKDETETIIPKKPWDPNVEKRVKDYEGGLFSTGKGGFSIGGGGGGSITFANTNLMWKASLKALEEIPLAQVDYAGGMIITDWYGGKNASDKEEIKITIRFLSDEISSSSFKIITHKRICIKSNCSIEMGKSSFNQLIKEKIVASARSLSVEEENKKKNN